MGRKIVVVNFRHWAVERENEMKVPATLLDGLLTFGSAPPRGHVIEINSAEAQIGGCRRPFGVANSAPRSSGHGRRHTRRNPLPAQAQRRGGARFPDRAPLLNNQ